MAYYNGKKVLSVVHAPTLSEKIITENGEYNASSDNADGYKKVTVNVQASGGNKLAQLIDKSITEITEEDLQGLTTIGPSAFYSCRNLSKLELPNSITTIDSSAFYSAKITDLYFSTGITRINSFSPFSGCTITNFRYKGTVEQWCQITFQSGENNPLSVSTNAYFNGISATNLVIPDTVTEIKDNAFYRLKCIENLTLGGGVSTIGSSAFYQLTALNHLVIPNNVTNIGSSSFSYCTSLLSIVIGTGVTRIGSRAFYSDNSLTSITIYATTPPTLPYADAFTSTNNCPIYVPAESVEAYKTATNWASLASRIQAIPT